MKIVLGRLGVIVLGLLLLAACGEDEQEPTSTPLPAATPLVTEEALATEEPAAQSTPSLDQSSNIFQRASEIAVNDLGIRLNINASWVTVLDPETSLLLADPLLCPEVTAENTTPYYMYLQYERFIYPYQFYMPTNSLDDLVVEACEDTLVDEDVLFVPTTESRPAVITAVQADLRAKGIDPEPGEYEIVEMIWNDTALGCALPPGEEAEADLIDGYLISYTLDGTTYEYHTDETGERLELCEPPVGYASMEAFIFTLEQSNILIERADETAQYVGLTEEGQLILVGSEGLRVGVLDFETIEEARQAADQINDERVSHIFVSGYVLLVQEEASSEVYGILSSFAENVRNPTHDNQDEAADDYSEDGASG